MTTDKKLLRNRFAANYLQYNSLAVVQDTICEQLARMIARLCVPEPGAAENAADPEVSPTLEPGAAGGIGSIPEPGAASKAGGTREVGPAREISEALEVGSGPETCEVRKPGTTSEISAALEIGAAPEPGATPKPGVVRQINAALEIGAGTGFLTRRLLEQYPAARWTINDLADEAAHFIVPYTENKAVSYLWGDAESIALPAGMDLVVTASTIQWFDDTPAFFGRIASVLNPEGFMALSTFGPENFREIKAVAGDGLEYYTADELTAMLSDRGFDVLEQLEYTKQLHFDTPVEVLRHIKATGVNSIRKKRWTRQHLAGFENRYRALFANPAGGVTLTYHPILIVARKRK